MSAYRSSTKSTYLSNGIGSKAVELLESIPAQRSVVFLVLIIGALIAFEVFNYGTTEYAMSDFIGNLTIMGIRWASILALAFCAIDFAGIARLFSPDRTVQDQQETWYLLAAWLLAATMNALLTWWAISLALLNHGGLGNEILGRESIIKFVPIFLAILVWVIRVLIIGSLTMTTDRLLTGVRTGHSVRKVSRPRSAPAKPNQPGNTQSKRPVRPAPKPATRKDPTYSPEPMVAKSTKR